MKLIDEVILPAAISLFLAAAALSLIGICVVAAYKINGMEKPACCCHVEKCPQP